MPNTKMSRKSQVTIPADVRRRAGIALGEELVVEEEDGRIFISKADPSAWIERMEAFRGDHWNAVADALRGEREQWDQRL